MAAESLKAAMAAHFVITWEELFRLYDGSKPIPSPDKLNHRGLGRDIKSEVGTPIIQVTHEIHEAFPLGDEVLSLVKGMAAHRWMLTFLMRDRLGSSCLRRIDCEHEADPYPNQEETT